MEKLNLAYLTPDSARAYNFYLIPKELIDNSSFDRIDYGSKILYSLMLNRASLSAVNAADFTDKKGNLYIIYTVEQVMSDMRCSNKTAIKFMKQLDDIGLIEKKRQGQGKPTIIYVKDFSTVNFQKCKKYTSRNEKSTGQDVEKVQPNNINRNQTNTNQNESIYQGESKVEAKDNKAATPPIDTIDNPIRTYSSAEVADKISLDELKAKYHDRHDEVGMLHDIVCEILTVDNTISPTFRISKQNIPYITVKKTFESLEKSHIEYVLDCLHKNDNKHKIKGNTKSYLMTALFHAPRTITYYHNRTFNKPEPKKDIYAEFIEKQNTKFKNI